MTSNPTNPVPEIVERIAHLQALLTDAYSQLGGNADDQRFHSLRCARKETAELLTMAYRSYQILHALTSE